MRAFFLILVIIAIGGSAIFLLKEKGWLLPAKKNFPEKVMLDKIDDRRGLGYSGQRKIVEGGGGNIFTTYRKKSNGKYEIYSSRIFLGSNSPDISGNANPISPVERGVDQRVPSIAVDQNQNLHVVWYGSDDLKQENDRQIKYSRSSTQGKDWTPWRNVDFVSGYAGGEFWQEHPSLAVGNDGAIYVVWEGRDVQNENQQIKFAKSVNTGDTWSRWKNVKPSPSNVQSRPQIIENRNGDLYIIMYSDLNGENGRDRIEYSISKDKGETWSSWKAISDPEYDSRHPSAASDNSGNIHLAWRQGRDGSPSKIMYSSLDASSNFTTPKIIKDSSYYQFFPSLGILAGGSPVIAWMETDDPSGFPSEDPQKGDIYAVILDEGRPGPVKSVSDRAGGLYPNLPSLSSSRNRISIIYEEPSKNGEYAIMIHTISRFPVSQFANPKP